MQHHAPPDPTTTSTTLPPPPAQTSGSDPLFLVNRLVDLIFAIDLVSAVAWEGGVRS